ncbi:MAG TPA: FecR family protein [Puia sp.]|jgi:ferric-dicitrate binding protein FerR (iron transport regulator)
MGNFEYNSMEDLVFSRSFRNWVLNRNSPEAGFWENWIARHPERRPMVSHAKAVIYALQLNLERLSEEEIDTEVQKALQRLEEAPRGLPEEGLPGRPRRGMGRFAGATHFGGRYARPLEWAALVAGICLVAWFVYRGVASRHRDVFHSFLAAHVKTSLRQQAADTTAGRTIVLPDGSSAQLGAGSKLYYPADLSTVSGRREIYLEGEAFFDIKRDPARPFYVYTGHLITKVLGTSFRIRAWPTDGRTTVTVRTGKVSVYREDDFYANASGANEPGGIILTPNQQIVYNREEADHRLNKTLADDPRPLEEDTRPATAPGQTGRQGSAESMVFDATPVVQVFRRLQQLYGIPIMYDEETLSSCSLSATMGKESFYEKLNVICKAINASYEVIDGNVVITAPGCK